jgi:hypothetical protein
VDIQVATADQEGARPIVLAVIVGIEIFALDRPILQEADLDAAANVPTGVGLASDAGTNGTSTVLLRTGNPPFP